MTSWWTQWGLKQSRYCVWVGRVGRTGLQVSASAAPYVLHVWISEPVQRISSVRSGLCWQRVVFLLLWNIHKTRCHQLRLIKFQRSCSQCVCGSSVVTRTRLVFSVCVRSLFSLICRLLLMKWTLCCFTFLDKQPSQLIYLIEMDERRDAERRMESKGLIDRETLSVGESLWWRTRKKESFG